MHGGTVKHVCTFFSLNGVLTTFTTATLLWRSTHLWLWRWLTWHPATIDVKLLVFTNPLDRGGEGVAYLFVYMLVRVLRLCKAIIMKKAMTWNAWFWSVATCNHRHVMCLWLHPMPLSYLSVGHLTLSSKKVHDFNSLQQFSKMETKSWWLQSRCYFFHYVVGWCGIVQSMWTWMRLSIYTAITKVRC